MHLPSLRQDGSMGLKQRLQNDLTEAMRARDEVRLAVIRMALTAVTNQEVAGKQARELSDDDVRKVLSRELKKRVEAAAAFDDVNRHERAASERAEATVLQEYLPAQMSDDDLSALVASVIADLSAEEVPSIGAVMNAAQAKVAGRADGGRTATEVKRQLAV